MKIIIGLGNPGDKYKKTRHNVGFMFLDFFAEKNNFEDFSYETKYKGDVSQGKINGEKIILLKPRTFMNLSGESLHKIMQFYKLEASDFIVVYDDVSMDFGKLRYRNSGSAGGHNGIKDIIRLFGKDFGRIKIGIGNNEKYDLSDWVLGRFTEEELIDLEPNIFGETETLLFNTLNQ